MTYNTGKWYTHASSMKPKVLFLFMGRWYNWNDIVMVIGEQRMESNRGHSMAASLFSSIEFSSISPTLLQHGQTLHAGTRSSISYLQSSFCSNLLCWFFKVLSWQHIRAYHDGHRILIVHTHSNFIMLSHWETRLLAPCPDMQISHIILTAS